METKYILKEDDLKEAVKAWVSAKRGVADTNTITVDLESKGPTDDGGRYYSPGYTIATATVKE